MNVRDWRPHEEKDRDEKRDAFVDRLLELLGVGPQLQPQLGELLDEYVEAVVAKVKHDDRQREHC